MTHIWTGHGDTQARRTFRDERGSALIETALTFPLVLLLSISVFEFGRAFQHWQILTNAAREGARFAVLPGSTEGNIIARVQTYLEGGMLDAPETATIDVVQNAEIPIGDDDTASGSTVTVGYPFQFMTLGPLVRLIATDSDAGDAFTLTVSATMRNE